MTETTVKTTRRALLGKGAALGAAALGAGALFAGRAEAQADGAWSAPAGGWRSVLMPHTVSVWSRTARAAGDDSVLTTEYDIYGVGNVVHLWPWQTLNLAPYLAAGEQAAAVRLACRLVCTKAAQNRAATVWLHACSPAFTPEFASTDFQSQNPKWRNTTFTVSGFVAYESLRDWQQAEVPSPGSSVMIAGGWRDGWPDGTDQLAISLFLDGYAVA